MRRHEPTRFPSCRVTGVSSFNLLSCACFWSFASELCAIKSYSSLSTVVAAGRCLAKRHLTRTHVASVSTPVRERSFDLMQQLTSSASLKLYFGGLSRTKRFIYIYVCVCLRFISLQLISYDSATLLYWLGGTFFALNSILSSNTKCMRRLEYPIEWVPPG